MNIILITVYIITINILKSFSGDPSLKRHLLITPSSCILSLPSLGPRTNVAENLLLSSTSKVISRRVETTVFLRVSLDGDNVIVAGVCGHNHLGMCYGLLCCQASRHLLSDCLGNLSVSTILNCCQGIRVAFNRQWLLRLRGHDGRVVLMHLRLLVLHQFLLELVTDRVRPDG